MRDLSGIETGQPATIGRSFAIADLGWFRFSGLLAWLLWGAVHLVYLTDLWSRVQVLCDVGLGLPDLPALGAGGGA